MEYILKGTVVDNIFFMYCYFSYDSVKKLKCKLFSPIKGTQNAISPKLSTLLQF